MSLDESQLIFRISQLVRAVEASSGLSNIDILSRSILTFIGEAEAQGRTLNVSDIVNGSDFGTAPTVYFRLSELENAGWIVRSQDPRDRRARQVRLTEMARRAYATMSRETRKVVVSELS